VQLVRLVDDIFGKAATGQSAGSAPDDLTALAQRVLKREWERVKRGD